MPVCLCLKAIQGHQMAEIRQYRLTLSNGQLESNGGRYFPTGDPGVRWRVRPSVQIQYKTRFSG